MTALAPDQVCDLLLSLHGDLDVLDNVSDYEATENVAQRQARLLRGAVQALPILDSLGDSLGRRLLAKRIIKRALDWASNYPHDVQIRDFRWVIAEASQYL